MAGKYIDNSNYALSGYTLSGRYQSLTIGPAGLVGGGGIVGGTKDAYQIVSHGEVTGSRIGVTLQHGGSVANIGDDAVIEGIAAGVAIAGSGSVVANGGTIEATGTRGIGVSIAAAGLVSNSGFIQGYIAVAIPDGIGTVVNSGTIRGTGYETGAISLTSGATVTNIRGGLIEGALGIHFNGNGSITNNAGAKIVSTGQFAGVETSGRAIISNSGIIQAGASQSLNSVAIDIRSGSISNAASGVIAGEIYVTSLVTITNAGTIASTITGAAGVVLNSTGLIINEVGGTIACVHGASPTIVNAGVIEGVFILGGVVDNGDNNATIQGKSGISVGGVHDYDSLSATITNAGTVSGTKYFYGEYTHYAGVYSNTSGKVTITNSGTRAFIGGYFGIVVKGQGTATIVNQGTIRVTGNAEGNRDMGSGINLGAGLISNSDPHALIQGYYGVSALTSNGIASTIANAGRIIGTGTKSGWGAYIYGAGEITNSTRTALITGHLGVGVGGSGPDTVDNFGTIIGSGGTAVLMGASSDLVIDEAGSTFVGQVIGGGGTLRLAGIGGTLSGFGTQFTDFGTLSLLPTASWAFGGGNVLGGATVFVDNGTLANESTLTFDGTQILSGEISGGGMVDAAAGQTLLDGNLALTEAFTLGGGLLRLVGYQLDLDDIAHLNAGTIDGSGTLSTSGATSVGGLALQGGAVWENAGKILQSARITLGSGTRLIVEAGGTFDSTDNAGIAGAAASLVNAGTFEKTGSPGLGIIVPAFENDGRILAEAGTLYLPGAVTGTGSATIGSAGTLDFAGTVAATQTIHFAATAGGDLVLDDPSGKGLGFAGSIVGFGGSDRLDLSSFAFSGKPKLAWSQDGGSGTLTVTDGADVAKISLFGQYATARFKTAKDGGTGTVISYAATPTAEAALANPHR